MDSHWQKMNSHTTNQQAQNLDRVLGWLIMSNIERMSIVQSIHQDRKEHAAVVAKAVPGHAAGKEQMALEICETFQKVISEYGVVVGALLATKYDRRRERHQR